MRTPRTSVSVIRTVAVAASSALLLAACSSEAFEYDSSSSLLPRFAPSMPAYDTVAESKNLACETNLIEAQHHEYSDNTIIRTEDVNVAVVAAHFELETSSATDTVGFWIAPNTPDEPEGELNADYWVEMHAETESGQKYDYSFTDFHERAATLEVDGKTSDILDRIRSTQSSTSGWHGYPIPPGFAGPDDPLKFVTIKYNGESLARCTPAEGSSGTAEVIPIKQPTAQVGGATSRSTPSDPKYSEYTDALTEAEIDFRPGASGTYYSDQSICKGLTEGRTSAWELATTERLGYDNGDENARRIEIMVPILCPEHQPLVNEAKTGNVVQKQIPDGNFIVAQMRELNSSMVVQPGIWRTKQSPVSDCYYERSDGAGNIIDNNFVNFAQSLTVTIAASDGAFVSTRCGGWERVS